MESCSYPTLVAKTQSSTNYKIEFIDENKRVAIFPSKQYFTPICWQILTKFWSLSLSIFDVFDGWSLRIQGRHHNFFAGKSATVGSCHSAVVATSQACSYYCHHILFCKIQVRAQSGWSYLFWQPCDECIMKALISWNKNAQKQFHPTVQGLLHKPPSLYGKENNVISKICRFKYSPYVQPSITKDWENLAPEVAIFVSNNKNALLEKNSTHFATASTQTTIPLWKREQCHFVEMSHHHNNVPRLL